MDYVSPRLRSRCLRPTMKKLVVRANPGSEGVAVTLGSSKCRGICRPAQRMNVAFADLQAAIVHPIQHAWSGMRRSNALRPRSAPEQNVAGWAVRQELDTQHAAVGMALSLHMRLAWSGTDYLDAMPALINERLLPLCGPWAPVASFQWCQEDLPPPPIHEVKRFIVHIANTLRASTKARCGHPQFCVRR